jgi:hypothetical protein
MLCGCYCVQFAPLVCPLPRQHTSTATSLLFRQHIVLNCVILLCDYLRFAGTEEEGDRLRAIVSQVLYMHHCVKLLILLRGDKQLPDTLNILFIMYHAAVYVVHVMSSLRAFPPGPSLSCVECAWILGVPPNGWFLSLQGPDYEKFAKYKKTDKFAEMLGLRPEPKKNMLGAPQCVFYKCAWSLRSCLCDITTSIIPTGVELNTLWCCTALLVSVVDCVCVPICCCF